ncbi:MAG: hypothetical protein ABI083_04535 [Lapillicoccus sp.]
MKNTTQDLKSTMRATNITGMSPMIPRVRVASPQLGRRILADLRVEAQGTTLSAGTHVPALRGAVATGAALGYAPTTCIAQVTTTNPTFMDVADIRSGRPPV